MKRALDDDFGPMKRHRSDDASRNLIVNYLPKSVDEEQLRTMFQRYGEIERAKLMTEEPSGESKCYGFVKFADAQSAVNAIRGLNGHEMEGKKLRVAYSQSQRDSDDADGFPRGDSSRPSCDVFFSGFGSGSGFGTEQLRVLASKYGTVLEAKVLDTEKHPRGVGFVKFAEPNQAATCIESLNGLTFNVNGEKCSLSVKYPRAKEQERQMMQPPQQQQQQQQIRRPMAQGPLGGVGQPGLGGGLGQGLGALGNFGNLMGAAGTGDQLQQLLALVMLNPAAAGGLGALGGLGGQLGGGGMGLGGGFGNDLSPLGMAGAPQGNDGNVLFVRGFYEANEQEVKGIFDPYGATQIDIPKGNEGRPRNFCFVHMPDQSSALSAIKNLNGYALPSGKLLQVKFREKD